MNTSPKWEGEGEALSTWKRVNLTCHATVQAHNGYGFTRCSILEKSLDIEDNDF